MIRRASIFIACLIAGAVLAQTLTDRRPPWDALLLASFDRHDATDRTAYNRTPTVSSGATFTTRAVDFDGTANAEITFPDSTDFEAAPFSVSMWVRLDSAISARINVIGKNDNSGNYPGWYVHFSPASNIGWLFATVTHQSTGYKVIYSNAAGAADDDDGVWRHIVATCSDINAYGVFYINGVAQSMTQAAAGTVTTIASARPLTLAGLNSSNAHSSRMDGALDDVKIFNRVLSANEVGALYAQGIGATRP